MLKGLYTSALSLAVLEKKQEVSANNLANINTPGYKKETVISAAFPDMLVHRLNDYEVTGNKQPYVGKLTMGVRLDDIVIDHSDGIQQTTGNSQQLALSTDGYFVVMTPQGERYTRNGEFNVNPEGIICTSDGYPLMGHNGEINVRGGEFVVGERGEVYCAGERVDDIRVVTLEKDEMVKEGSSLFRAENPQEQRNPQVIQGALEGSNAYAIDEMMNMINIMRAYESNQKVMQTHDSTLEKAVSQIGQV